MPMKNEAVVLEAIKEIQLKEYPMPEIGDDDCLVEMKSIGICGSDVHYWQHGKIGDFVCSGPMVLGHESAGIVLKVGRNCKTVKVGDRVALEPGVPCHGCEQCGSGKYNLCPDIRFFATPPVHGSLARYVSHPEKYTFPLPENMTLEEGAMCEPLSVGVYACVDKAKVQPGKTYTIFGAGPIGTICALVANGLGAGKIILSDIQQNRLDFCQKLLPNTVVTINSTGMKPGQVVDAIKEANGGKLCDGAIDCAGVESVITAAIKSTKNGGSVCLVGMGKDTCTLPLLDASVREVDLHGVFRYRNTYPKCIELISSKKVDLFPLITHRFEFTYDSVMDAFETCRTGRDGAIKCMINIKDTPPSGCKL